jgi:putative tryptophan/tyrosine transport system substrate-binding protein
MQTSAKRRLHVPPAAQHWRQFAVEGALMSYGPDTADIFCRAVDRILKGAKPLLALADEVIE